MDSPISLQQLVGAAERLDARDREQNRQRADWLGAVEQARDRLVRRPFEALPVPAFVIREGDRERMVTSPQVVDRIIEQALLPRLTAAVEPLLLPTVHAYRRGRSTFTAARDATQLLARGLHEMAFLDIDDFFNSIDRETLCRAISDLLDPHEQEIVQALASAPLLLNGEIISVSRGIPLGRALSPVLANVYLVPLDRAMDAIGIGYLRYGDDILLAACTLEACNDAAARLADTLSGLGLKLNPEKTRRFRYDGTPFVYLGHAIDERGLFERVGERRLDRIVNRPRTNETVFPADTSVVLRPNRRARTLYVTEPSLYLSIKEGRVIVKRGKETIREIPLRRLDRVLVLAGVSMSSGFMSACITSNLPLLFFVGRGRAYGSLVASGMPNPLRLRAQYDLVSRAESRLGLAQRIVDAKLSAILRRLERQKVPVQAQRARVEALLHDVGEAPDAGVLRGIEGAATRAWYEVFALRIQKEGFEFTRRTKKPPRDPINSLLSFAYSLLFGEMQTALLAHGLDPYPGLLHDLRPRHPALASDLIEPYRVLLADTFVLSVVNRGQFEVADFEQQAAGGVYLSATARRRFLQAFEEFLARPLGPAGSANPRQLIDGAALAMLRVVVGESEQLVFPFRADEITAEPEEEMS